MHWVPDVDVGDGAEHAGGEQFHAAAQHGGSAALIAGLGDKWGRFGCLPQGAGFGDGVGQWFFALDVAAGLHGGVADGGVPVVGSGDDDGVERFFFFEEQPIIFVARGFGGGGAVALLAFGELLGIHVAQGGDVVAEFCDLADVPLDLSAHADEADLQSARGLSFLSVESGRGKDEQ